MTATRADGAPRRITPPTSLRIPRDVKAAAQAKAAKRGETLTDVVVRGLVEYVRVTEGGYR